MISYDLPEHDVFWKAVEELDTVDTSILVFHLRICKRNCMMIDLRLVWLHYSLVPTFQRHVLGLCINGVFDRAPGAKLLNSHMGEMIPAHLWRIGLAPRS